MVFHGNRRPRSWGLNSIRKGAYAAFIHSLSG